MKIKTYSQVKIQIYCLSTNKSNLIWFDVKFEPHQIESHLQRTFHNNESAHNAIALTY